MPASWLRYRVAHAHANTDHCESYADTNPYDGEPYANADHGQSYADIDAKRGAAAERPSRDMEP